MSINQEIVKPHNAMPSGLGSGCAFSKTIEVMYGINLEYQINNGGFAAVQYLL